jgi:hypothetical protein
MAQSIATVSHSQPFAQCDACTDESTHAEHDRATGQRSPLVSQFADIEQEAFSAATSAEAAEAGRKAEDIGYDPEERPSLESALACLEASYRAAEAHANAAEQAVGTVDGAQRAAHHARMARHHTEQVSKHTTYLGDDADDSMEWMAYDLADSAVQDARKAQAAEFAGIGMTAPTRETTGMDRYIGPDYKILDTWRQDPTTGDTIGEPTILVNGWVLKFLPDKMIAMLKDDDADDRGEDGHKLEGVTFMPTHPGWSANYHANGCSYIFATIYDALAHAVGYLV